jgi:hypothetical protein
MIDSIAANKYKIVSEFISEDSEDFSRRFSDIAQAALHRTEAAEAFLHSGVQNAGDFHSGTFFQQLANQKALHRRIIEKIGRDFELLPYSMNDDVSEPLDETILFVDHSVSSIAELGIRIRNIFEIVYEKALDELNFYLNFLLIEKHPVIASLLLSLANLSKDYLFEVKLRYLERQSQIEMGDPEKIVEHFLKIEQLSN